MDNSVAGNFDQIAGQIAEKHFSHNPELADDIRTWLIAGFESSDENYGFARFSEALGLEQAIRIFSDFLNEEEVLRLEEDWMAQHWVR